MSRVIKEKFKQCPYHYIRHMAHSYDIILMPYFYIFNEKERLKLKINIKGSVVIFDEAHNIENFAEDSKSLSIPLNDIP